MLHPASPRKKKQRQLSKARWFRSGRERSAFVTEGDSIGPDRPEMKTTAWPHVLPRPPLDIPTARLRGSQRTGERPLIWLTTSLSRPGIPVPKGCAINGPGLRQSGPEPEIHFKEVFLWIRYVEWFSFPFVMCHGWGVSGGRGGMGYNDNKLPVVFHLFSVKCNWSQLHVFIILLSLSF